MSETHWRKLTNPNFLGSWDVPSGSIWLTISKVEKQMVYNQDKRAEEPCIVASFFDGGYKPMILNKTNCKQIQAQTDTPMIEKWSGFKIEIRVEKVKYKGALVDGLRIGKVQLANAPTQKNDPPKCSDCAKPIEQLGNYTPEQMAKARTEKYGRPLCDACAKAEKARIDGGTEQQ